MIQDTFESGFVIKRRTTSNLDGVAVVVENDLASVDGRMRELSANEVIANDKKGYIASYRFYTNLTELRPTDIIYDSNRSMTYEVKSITNPMQMDEFLQVDCEIVK